jgi:hypothetical protein
MSDVLPHDGGVADEGLLSAASKGTFDPASGATEGSFDGAI